MSLSVEKFREYNPYITLSDNNSNGLVDEGDTGKNVLTDVEFDWSSRQMQKAVRNAKRGLRSIEGVKESPVGMFGGIAADIVLSETLLPISILYGIFGRKGNFVTRVANTWTFFPRLIADTFE